MKKAFLYIGIILFVAGIIVIGAQKEAKRECEMWKIWRKEYNLFEPSEQQKENCKEYGIDLGLIPKAHAQEIEENIVSWYDYTIQNGKGVPCRRGHGCYED